MNELGIKNVKELAVFDIKILEEKFGKNKAKLLQDKSRGIDDSPVEKQERKQISRLGTLKENTDNIEIIFEKIKELTIGMKKKIEKEKVSFRTISLITIDTALKMQTRSETIQPSDNVDSILPITKSLLEKFFEGNSGKKLRRIGISVSNLSHKKQQKNLQEF